LRRYCALGAEATALLREAALRGHLSAGGLDHAAEAIGYRTLERKGLAA
jgi:hypothetical protein